MIITHEYDTVTGIERLSNGLLAVSVAHIKVIRPMRGRAPEYDRTYRVDYMNERQADESIMNGMKEAIRLLRFSETTKAFSN